jgi:hypothetical protein
MWLQHEIAFIGIFYFNCDNKSFLQKKPTEEFLEPEINTGTFHVYFVTLPHPLFPLV